MKKYLGVKIVEAEPMTYGEFLRMNSGKNPDPLIQTMDQGYMVIYPDGYISWCPTEQFEEANRPIDGMTFGMAVESMKQYGLKVRRAGWNGKGMFLFLNPASDVTVTEGRPLAAAIESGTPVHMAPYIMMKTADANLTCVPWLASQTDVLAEDWEIVTE